MNIKTTFIPLLLLAAFVSGCATNIKPTADTNPSPSEKFSNFNRFELQPVQAGSGEVAAQKPAMAKIGEHVQEKLGTRLQQWNEKPLNGAARTLVIEPTVTELKFVSGAKRVFTGAWSGSSAVIMKAKFTDKQTGKTIASPEFYSKSSAMAGAYSFGGNDNAMLRRIADSLAIYVFKNYKQAVGGPVMPTNEEAASVSTE
ncbi:DUF4410 domain-containing protein [Methylomagnum sp.]